MIVKVNKRKADRLRKNDLPETKRLVLGSATSRCWAEGGSGGGMKLEVEALENRRPERKVMVLGSGFSQSWIAWEIIGRVRVEVRVMSFLKLRGADAAADLRAIGLGFKVLNPFWKRRGKTDFFSFSFWGRRTLLLNAKRRRVLLEMTDVSLILEKMIYIL